MEKPNKLTDITAVIYPSNHVLKNSPKIALLGKGSHWKDELISQANNYWTESPVTFFYSDQDEYDSDVLSWLLLNVNNCHFVVGRITEDIDDIALIAPYVTKTNTFLMYRNVKDDLKDWFETLNPNRESTTDLAIILKIKDIWIKNVKYNNVFGEHRR